jgi:hypothetical protein
LIAERSVATPPVTINSDVVFVVPSVSVTAEALPPASHGSPFADADCSLSNTPAATIGAPNRVRKIG